jgi:hypothetical protein
MDLLHQASFLYQIETRILLRELSEKIERPAKLADIPDALLDWLKQEGFHYVWLLGMWQTGPEGLKVARFHPDLQSEYREALSNFTEEDVAGSPFSISGYTPHTDFGSRADLLNLRDRLHERGMKLILDFIPNHTALDHLWVYEHPEFYVQGDDRRLAEEPGAYLKVGARSGDKILAHGRDPNFPCWSDTLQLNYRHSGLRQAMAEELTGIAELADGVRCDMAMLILPDIFYRTWGERSQPADGSLPIDASFWEEAIPQVRARHPDFLFLAEAYWDLEWTLMQQGFDYAYDKRLYDRLRARNAPGARAHLHADLDFQRRLVRFMENHDETRAAKAFPANVHRAAAVVTFLTPGMRFFHDGQLEGRRVRFPVQLSRRPKEPVDEEIRGFYYMLLECLRRPEVREGVWRLLDCRNAWEGNPTWENFIAYDWQGKNDARLLVAVNYGPTQGQCYVDVPFAEIPVTEIRGRKLLLQDLMSPARYERDGDDMASRGLYLDMPEWGYHIFEVKTLG